MTMIFSLNVMSATSNCNSTVAIGASNCPLTTIIWNSVEAPSFKIVCGASNRILRQSASAKALDKSPKSMRSSKFTYPKSIGKYGILRSFSNGKFVESGRNLVSPSGVTWICGKFWSSVTAICLCWFSGLGWNFGSTDVSD